MLYEVVNVGDQKAWCGPTVVAAITGLTIPAVKARIKKARGHNGPVMGTSSGELAAVLRGAGYNMNLSNRFRKDDDMPTLAQWLKGYRVSGDDTIYIINVSHHWVVVKGRWFCDTYTKGIPVRASKAPHRRKRVKEVYAVRKAHI